MRGNDQQQANLISYVSLEQRVPSDHPLRGIRKIVDSLLVQMDSEFEALYASTGRPSIPPERLLRALLLQIFYSVRSERMLMEQLNYNLLFRWFVGLEVDEPVWNHAVFSKNRERLLNEDVARSFFTRVVKLAESHMSSEHFTVDGTLLEAWASQKSFSKKDDDNNKPNGNFHGEQRRNDTHASKTDPDAKLYRKGNGKEAKLCYFGHILIDNRAGLIRDAMTTQADGHAETDAALLLLQRLKRKGRRVTLGADKGYDQKAFVKTARELGVTPHVASKSKGSAVNGRTTRHAGYRVSQSKRTMVERVFGWMKQTGGLAKVKLRGIEKVSWLFTYCAAAYNLLRIKTLQEKCA
jgi:transposase